MGLHAHGVSPGSGCTLAGRVPRWGCTVPRWGGGKSGHLQVATELAKSGKLRGSSAWQLCVAALRWVALAVAMSDSDEEKPSPVTAFLAPLGSLGQHRAVMKKLGTAIYISPPGAAPGVCTSVGKARGETHLGLHSMKCVPY